MKKRIEQLLNGKFEYETASLVMLPEELNVWVVPGEVTRGSLWIESSDGKKVKGFLYSSNPRMICEPAEFQGIRNEIHYQVDGNGFPKDGEEGGYFTVCSELGEYKLPFTLRQKEQAKQEAAAFPFEKPEEIVPFAQQNFVQGYRCFIGSGYRALLAKRAPELLDLYDGLAVPSVSYRTFEEFLTGAGYKEPIELTVDRQELMLTEVSEPVGEKIQITKNTWGFQKITVESDAKFLRPERKLITTDEFAGSTYELNVVIDANRMHAGKNYGRVVLSTPYQRLNIEVTASRSVSSGTGRQKHICKIMQKKLENLYVSFRMKKIDLPTWVERSVNVINSYKRAGGADPFADLFLLQLYFADGKKQKAMKLLETLESHQEQLNTPERYGFYLYLTTFFYQEASYVDRVEAEIRSLFYQDQTNWKLQWILMYLQESLLNDENAKYEAVGEQFRCGCRSRIMYLEAYQILRDNPFLMRHIGPFELQLLRFAAKEKVLTAEVMRQTANLTMHYGKYSGQLLDVLRQGEEQYSSADLIKAICLLLMKGERHDVEAFAWYAKGVDCGLRITGLYEYYMESMEDPDLQKMPQIIRMYFAYDTTLDYRKRAAIYRKITENREKDPQTYRTYRAAIEKFTVDQLEMGRLTDDLGVLYREFLRKKLLTRQMAEQLVRLLFTYEISCEAPDIRSVTVHSGRLVREQSAVFSNGKAQIAIYDPDSVLILENQEGERCTAEVLIQRRKRFDSGEMLEWCTQLIPDFPGIVLFVCSGCVKEQAVNRNSLPYLQQGCEQEEFSETFRMELRRIVLHYYTEHVREESLPEFLEQISYLDYVKADKAALITLLAEEGLCQDAFSLLDVYGAEGIPLLQLVRICSRMIIDLEFSENPMLLSLCWHCFQNDKYNDKLLRYLQLYYEGSIQEMEQVWEAAREFDLDTMLIEEKIMMMILFTRSQTQGSEPIFESYAKKMGRKKLCRAYLNLKAYEYFVRGLPTAECVFRYLEKDYAYYSGQGRIEEQEEVCRLALLQHYAGKIRLEHPQREYAAQLLEEFSVKGMRFAFWQKFDAKLLRPYELEGRVFVEYVGNPGSTVSIYYRRRGTEEEYTKEAVKNCFEGIFVREFTLFFGDELECWFEEVCDGKQKKTDLRILTPPKASLEGGSQYDLVNRISKAQTERDEQTLDAELDNYLLLEYLAKELFSLM